MWAQIKKPGWTRQAMAFLLGCVFVALQFLLTTWLQPTGASALDARRLPSPGTSPALLVQHFWATVNSLPWIGLLFVLFATLAVVQRNKENGWLNALMAGVAFLGVLSQIFAKV